jgi:hypothetical protein
LVAGDPKGKAWVVAAEDPLGKGKAREYIGTLSIHQFANGTSRDTLWLTNGTTLGMELWFVSADVIEGQRVAVRAKKKATCFVLYDVTARQGDMFEDMGIEVK